MKIKVHPKSMANSPPGAKGSWRQPVAAAAATKAPKKHRAAKRKPLNSRSACCYEAQQAAGCYKAQQAAGCYQPGPSRQRRKARRAAVTAGHATAALAPSLLSLPPSVESQAPRLSLLRLCLAQRLWLCHQGLAWPHRNGGHPSDRRARSAWRWTSPPPPPPPRQDLPLLSKLALRTCTCPRSRTRTSPCRRRSSRTTSTTSIHGCARAVVAVAAAERGARRRG